MAKTDGYLCQDINFGLADPTGLDELSQDINFGLGDPSPAHYLSQDVNFVSVTGVAAEVHSSVAVSTTFVFAPDVEAAVVSSVSASSTVNVSIGTVGETVAAALVSGIEVDTTLAAHAYWCATAASSVTHTTAMQLSHTAALVSSAQIGQPTPIVRVVEDWWVWATGRWPRKRKII